MVNRENPSGNSSGDVCGSYEGEKGQSIIADVALWI